MSSSFFHILVGGAYDGALGWLCHPLTVSGAKVEELRIGGSAISPELYKVDPPYIRLIAPPSPSIPDATIKICIRENKRLDASIWVAVIGLVGVIAVPLITKFQDGKKSTAVPSPSPVVVAPSSPKAATPNPQVEPTPTPKKFTKRTAPKKEITAPFANEKPAVLSEGKPTTMFYPKQTTPPTTGYQNALQLKETGNYAQAMEQFRILAESGNPKAQYQLGNMYLLGLGVPKDASKAAPWLERAANAQIPQAQHNLGVMYQRGDGVPRDDHRAMDLITAAARNNWEPSKALLKEAGQSR